jgi:hypothetical protein
MLQDRRNQIDSIIAKRKKIEESIKKSKNDWLKLFDEHQNLVNTLTDIEKDKFYDMNTKQSLITAYRRYIKDHKNAMDNEIRIQEELKLQLN